MTNTDLLKKKILDSGVKYKYLAQKLGISRQWLLKKINNEREFTAGEISILCEELGISKMREKDTIFFAGSVDLKSHLWKEV